MIELMVVIAIVGILVAIAAPSFTESMARRRLEGIANELSADLQYAKSQAANINLSVSLVTTSHGYTVVSTAGGITTTHKVIALGSTSSLTDAITVTFEPHRALPVDASSIALTHSQTSASLQVNTNAVGQIQICSPGASLGGYAAC